MTQDEVLLEARSRWGTPQAKEALLEKYRCSENYLYQILTGNKRMPRWMLVELSIEKVRVTEYRRR